MNLISKLILSSSFVFAAGAGVAHAAPDAAMQADGAAINTACADDAKTAGCGSEIVGKGLLKCLAAYKKANKGFKFSDACKTARMQRHADKKAGK